MYNHWKKQGQNVYFISFAPLKHKSSISHEELEVFFKSELGKSVSEVMNSPGYLITDETQLIYDTGFWGNLKSGAKVRKVLSFAVYGLSRGFGFIRSPDVFQGNWYYEDIKYSNEECEELVEAFCSKVPHARDILVPEILGNVFQFVNNHPGLVFRILYTLCYEFRRGSYNATSIADFQNIIVKGNLFFKLLEAPCFSLYYKDIQEMLGERTNAIMGSLIANGSIDLDRFDNIRGYLNRCGMCIADCTQSRLHFSSEIMRMFYSKLYYRALYGFRSSFIVSNWRDETMLSVLKRILELFQPQSLRSVGRNGNLYDRIYREFYRSCFLIAPTECHLEVGGIYGSNGFLDFYFEGDIQFGFELLHNGVKINGDGNRFDAENGIYKGIPLRDYVALDFYQADTFDRNYFIGDKCYAVVFSADFNSIQLWHNGNEVDSFPCGKTQ